jgi:hypothetical protein
VLLRGRGDEPWTIERLSPMGALSSLSHIELRHKGRDASAASATSTLEPGALRIPLRVISSTAPRVKVHATFIARRQLPLLRRLAYLLPRAALTRVRIAETADGAFLRWVAGSEAIPLGTFFSEIHPRLYLLAGHQFVPAVGPEAIALAFGFPDSHVLFVGADERAVAIDESAFVSLESALLEAPPWVPAIARAIAKALDEAPVDLKTTSIGMMPLRGVEPPGSGG